MLVCPVRHCSHGFLVQLLDVTRLLHNTLEEAIRQRRPHYYYYHYYYYYY